MTPHTAMSSVGRCTLVAVAALQAAACTTVVRERPTDAVVAQLAVERFLEAANARDIETMGRLFGTSDGPVLDTGSTFGCAFKKIGSWFGGTPCEKRSEVEIRLDAIARVLRHEDFAVVGEERVAGRIGQDQAVRILVDLTIQGEPVPGVPFVVVRASGGQWLVEAVDLERVMVGGVEP